MAKGNSVKTGLIWAPYTIVTLDASAMAEHTLIFNKKKKAKGFITREEFAILHEVCPTCGSGQYCTTLMAYIDHEDSDYIDENHVDCSGCNWSGKAFELVQKNGTV